MELRLRWISLVAKLALVALVAPAPGCTGRGTAAGTEAPAAPAPAPAPVTEPAAPARPDAARLLQTVELDGRPLAVYAATLPGGRACWTYVTRGHTPHELVVTVAARDGEDRELPPEDALGFLRAATAVSAGTVALTPWSWRELAGGAFGRDDLTGVAAVPARGPAGVDLPAGAVTLLAVTQDELALVRVHGVPRLAAMLARTQRYPASWIDRDRSSLVTSTELGRDVLSRSVGAYEEGITAFLDVGDEPALLSKPPHAPGGWYLDGTWRLRVTPAAAPRLIDYLRRLSPRSLTTIAIAPDELAGGVFAWAPGEHGPQLVRGAGAELRPAATLIGFVPRKVHTGAQLVDDAVMIYLSLEQRDAVVAALTTGQDVTIEPPTPGMTPWRLEWNR